MFSLFMFHGGYGYMVCTHSPMVGKWYRISSEEHPQVYLPVGNWNPQCQKCMNTVN